MGNWDNPPSRAEVDRLAEQYVGKIGWDGKTPLDEAGQRLYAVRDAGYMGPVGRDCYPVTEGPEVEILRDLRERNARSAQEQADEDVA